MGVDLFFVLSGFLITTLLLQEHAATGRVSLRSFYRRRVLRLAPALVVVVALTPVVLWTLGDDRLGQTLRSVPSALFYVMNWQEAAGASGGMLSMTWSLAIEEQFYLLWPPVLVALLNAGRRRLAVVIAGAVVGYAWVARPLFLYGSDFLSNRAYFATDTRADGLMLGCLLALVLPALRARSLAVAAPAAGLLLAVMVLSPFPAGLVLVGFLGLVNLAATACVALVVVAPRCGLARLLRWKPLVEVGRRSYGIYLWHGLTILIGRAAYPDHPVAQAVLVLALTITAVQLSWQFVETPFLARRRQPAALPTTAASPSASVPEGASIATAAHRIPPRSQ